MKLRLALNTRTFFVLILLGLLLYKTSASWWEWVLFVFAVIGIRIGKDRWEK